jgi:putative membrane protein
VELGRLAQQRATRPEVKEFAEMAIRDHEKAASELKQIASKHNIPMDTGEQNEHNDLRERLSKLSGEEFDREYVKTMVEEHKEAVNELERKANDENPEVRQWASNTLPTVRQHLERAQQIEKSLGQRSGN